MDLNLLGNDDAQGFLLERDAVGVLNLAGTLGTGSSFDDDNGNVAGNGNTSGGLAPIVNVVTETGGQQINIVDASSVATP